jgi:hypothetical protein
MGRLLLAGSTSSVLGMGMTSAIFQALGNMPWVKLELSDKQRKR